MPDTHPMNAEFEHPLVVRDLVARYGDLTILDGVSMTVRAGEIRVILGGSGSGKSTLLKHVIGLIRPAAGSVELLGVDLAQADEPEIEAVMGNVGMMFQAGALLNSLTLEENIALPLRERTNLPDSVISDIVAMKLAMLGLGHAALLSPRELSGGMLKRAAIARAMVLDPAVLFCDEPSAGLDPVTAADLDALLKGLRDRFGMAVVVVTHELASIESIADCVTMLGRGKVLADGPFEEVRRMEHPIVRAFFDRKGDDAAEQPQTVLSAMNTGVRGSP